MRSVLCTFWFLAKIFGGVMYGRVLEMCRPKCIFFTTVSFFLTSVVVVCVQSFDEKNFLFFIFLRVTNLEQESWIQGRKV